MPLLGGDRYRGFWTCKRPVGYRPAIGLCWLLLATVWANATHNVRKDQSVCPYLFV